MERMKRKGEEKKGFQEMSEEFDRGYEGIKNHGSV